MGGENEWFILSESNIYGNLLVAFYLRLPVIRKDTIFVLKYQNILVGQHLLNYKDIFVGTPIYIKVCSDHCCLFYIYACH